ncbi:MAG: hypothetical protein OXH24_07740, partial [Cyanobacteria bacterium MAG IRC3_bin_20]|nr:hypothetical protein [Cyanobacteria bacterium MAG IRC3_bin_20]
RGVFPAITTPWRAQVNPPKVQAATVKPPPPLKGSASWWGRTTVQVEHRGEAGRESRRPS